MTIETQDRAVGHRLGTETRTFGGDTPDRVTGAREPDAQAPAVWRIEMGPRDAVEDDADPIARLTCRKDRGASLDLHHIRVFEEPGPSRLR